MFRILRRLLIVLALFLLPLYAVSWFEELTIPAPWREIAVGDSHDRVRTLLRDSGMGDQQCEWLPQRRTARCTLIGSHHAAGVVVRFDRDGRQGRVVAVEVREPIYTGPFHWHARLKRIAIQ
jgi:YD repeat-containing protein